MSGREPPAWAVDYHAALAQGDYLRALEVARGASDDNAPISFMNDSVVYLLQAMSRFADADAVRSHRAQLEQQRGLEALPPELQQAIRAAPEHEQSSSNVAGPQTVDPEQAPAALVSAVRQHRVVILCEEHPQPEHRAFGARVLAQLRAAGVTHLALETGGQLALDQARSEARIRPTTDNFSFEPQRAALLRAALRLDLPVVAFDMDSNDNGWLSSHRENMMQFRERRMAEHIAERILEPDPAARVLVWVGHGYGQKRKFPLQMMAMHLWEITGDEPFSAYQLTGAGNRPDVDLLIRHPEPRYQRDRPDWLRADRHSVRGAVRGTGDCLVQALLAAEGPLSTPVDQLLTDASRQFELLVPDDDYLLRVWVEPGATPDAHPITIIGPRTDLRITL